MRIALLGGTGDIGEGLALRWAQDTDHDLVIGSRDAEKAERKAAEYESELADRGVERSIESAENPAAASGADAVVLSIPPRYVRGTVEDLGDRLDEGAVLVSPAVGMTRDEDGFHYNPPSSTDSVTELVARAAPDGVPVVGAFHNLPAGRLSNLDAPLGLDTLVLADDDGAKATVMDLAEGIEGLRAVDGGALANAHEVEGITPLLINVAMNNEGMDHLGVEFK